MRTGADDAAIDALLASLPGQWIEATRLEHASGGAPARSRIVTSRGCELTALGATVWDRPVRDRDSAATGLIITATRLDPDGSLTWALMRADTADATELSVAAPWALRGMEGEAAAATGPASGRIGHHPPTGPRFATPEALAAWAARPPARIDLELLDAASDDWLQVPDIVGALVEAGVTDDAEILRRGIDLAAGLLVRGDLVGGMIGDDGFVPSPETVPELVERLGTTWTALGAREVGFGGICWFDLTEAGRERLRGIADGGPSSGH